MRKSIINAGGSVGRVAQDEWMGVERLAAVEVTSEAEGHPIESALAPGREGGWRASGLGTKTIRLVFDEPRRVHRVRLRFAERHAERAQEFVLRCVPEGSPALEVVRQQWAFSPGGSTEETEDYRVDVPGVTALELAITPDISGGDARASLGSCRWRKSSRRAKEGRVTGPSRTPRSAPARGRTPR